MRGKASLTLRAGRLEALRPRRPSRTEPRWNLDALSDEDLEALLPLAEKRAAGEAVGAEPAWAAEEVALLGRLWAKQAGKPA